MPGQLENSWAKQDLMLVATHQRNIMRVVLFGLIAGFLMGLFMGNVDKKSDAATVIVILALVMMIGLFILQIYNVYSLATAMRLDAPWKYLVGVIFPYTSPFVMLYIVNKSNKLFTANGIGVGLMGAKIDELEQMGSDQ